MDEVTWRLDEAQEAAGLFHVAVFGIAEHIARAAHGDVTPCRKPEGGPASRPP